mgnify:CR=1 FL=1
MAAEQQQYQSGDSSISPDDSDIGMAFVITFYVTDKGDQITRRVNLTHPDKVIERFGVQQGKQWIDKHSEIVWWHTLNCTHHHSRHNHLHHTVVFTVAACQTWMALL